MTCTHQKTTTVMGSKQGRAVFRGTGMTAIVDSFHRGGCLFCSTIFVRNDSNGKSKTISSTDPTGCYASVGDTSPYLLSLAKKHVS